MAFHTMSWALLKKVGVLVIGVLSPFLAWGALLLWSEFSLRHSAMLMNM